MSTRGLLALGPRCGKPALGEILAGEGIDHLLLGERLCGKPQGEVAAVLLDRRIASGGGAFGAWQDDGRRLFPSGRPPNANTTGRARRRWSCA